MLKRIIDGIVTSQSKSENATCLQKIVEVDKSLNEFYGVASELNKLINSFITAKGFKFEDVSGIKYGPEYMFKAAPFDCYFIYGTSENTISLRVKYNTLSPSGNLENNGFIYTGNLSGVAPLFIVLSIMVDRVMYICVIHNKGGGQLDPKQLYTKDDLSIFRGTALHAYAPTIYVESPYSSPLAIYHVVKED